MGTIMSWAFILFLGSNVYTWQFDSRKDCTTARGLFVAYPVSRCVQVKEEGSEGGRISGLTH
jgi:hypothetical protein